MGPTMYISGAVRVYRSWSECSFDFEIRRPYEQPDALDRYVTVPGVRNSQGFELMALVR